MKKLLTFCVSLLLGLTAAHADEGMWLLKLMTQQHLEDSLRRAGLQLSPEELYSETSSSLRECVGIFGGGCTGEVVSPNGLVFTNHHCGFGYVHDLSAVGHDYVKEGYFAKSLSEELPTEDLTFTFVLAVREVTDEVTAAARKQGADEYLRQSHSFLDPLAEQLLKKSAYKKKKGMVARIVPYFGGNRFYIFYEQVYEDVRLVVNPPYNVGQFGDNSDNWMWPRQNADFAVFRIYADKQGQPAAYSADNVPLQCSRYLPISLKGMQEGDFTMIMGFPGRTSRYLTASEVTLRTESSNAPYVLVGNPLLRYYKGVMEQSDSLRLLLEDDYFMLGNSVKNFGGMNEAVEKTHLVEQKKAEEAAFRSFAATSRDTAYDGLLERIDATCAAYRDTLYDAGLYQVVFGLLPLQAPLSAVDRLSAAVKEGKAKNLSDAKEALRAACPSAEHLDIVRGQAHVVVPYFAKNKKLALCPDFTRSADGGMAFIDTILEQSVYFDTVRLARAIDEADIATLQSDPLARYTQQLKDYSTIRSAAQKRYAHRIGVLDKAYVRGLCEMYQWSKAPDANFTLRMTYGHVADLHPRDAVRYDWRTVLDGMFEKESRTESDYFVNDTLRALYHAGDFGRYAREDGKLPTCFLSNNDITGGNSGSPVLNARGELIGLAFDGNIESLSSDLKFNPSLQRCINVDIRYVLFLLEKFGKSTYLFDELEVRE